MKKAAHRLFISESVGSISAESVIPEKAKYLFAMAHGAGAGMNHRFMVQLAEALREKGIATLRYNLPYMEKGKRRPDPPAIAEKAIKEVILKSNELFPYLTLFAGGKSFGGRITSQLLAKEKIPFVKGIIFVGFPLHPAGKPDVKRSEHLRNVQQPMLFLQGTRDALADMTLIEKVCNSLSSATLSPFEGADHSFKSGKKEFILELAARVENWIINLK